MELLIQNYPKLNIKLKSLGFGLLVTQIKLFENVTLGFGQL